MYRHTILIEYRRGISGYNHIIPVNLDGAERVLPLKETAQDIETNHLEARVSLHDLDSCSALFSWSLD